MRRRFVLVVMLSLTLPAVSFALGPAETVVDAEQVLSDFMAIPARQIPQALLSEAQAVAIIPNVVKVGFVGAARRGHGVVMVRDDEGEWSLPQFMTLTGGSVGFQAGIQGTDVILVFTTREGVDGLMRGKFTVGVDAAVAAGPVGRDAAIGTDATLRSEIYSYSRSRGLFLGVALDGSVLEVNHEAHAFYYGTPTDRLPTRIPRAAADLRGYLDEVTPHRVPILQPDKETPITVPAPSPRTLENLRRSINEQASRLHAQLDPDWRRYLAVPSELQQPGVVPSKDHLARVLKRYDRVSTGSEYQDLASLPEFQRTYELLIEYEKIAHSDHPVLRLSPPPSE